MWSIYIFYTVLFLLTLVVFYLSIFVYKTGVAPIFLNCVIGLFLFGHGDNLLYIFTFLSVVSSVRSLGGSLALSC
jgi:hypothetical protein